MLIKLSFLILVVSVLSACTTPAEEDEPSNNAAPAEDAGGETPDASVSDVEDEEEISQEVCSFITDPTECMALEGVCQLINFYPVTIEDGQCVLSPEPSEKICTSDELLQDGPHWIWVRFNEDGTYDAGLVRERAGNHAWQRCPEGVDVEECACDGLALADALPGGVNP